MDHRKETLTGHETGTTASSGFDPYVTENGERIRVPYRIIKMAVFTDVSKEQLIDLPHAARLQYRLMLHEPVLKATVDFTRSKITVIYNPDTADNLSPKMSLPELKDLLQSEGISIKAGMTANEDYDYYTNFYSRAYNPPQVRESAPYGYTLEQWRKIKPEWEAKMKAGNAKKKIGFKEFQQEYLEEQPIEVAKRIDPNFVADGKVRKPGKKAGKGFWFHGV